jgi:deoxyribodipyrimidine photo-lyase
MKILLVHDEMLNDRLPVFATHADTARIFVLDPAFIASEGWALKRIQFVVDCVAEMQNVRIFHGALADVCRELGATSLVTQSTPNHAIQRWLASLSSLAVSWHDEPQFVDYDGKLTRFTAYWKSVAPQWFSEDVLIAENARGGSKLSRSASSVRGALRK